MEVAERDATADLMKIMTKWHVCDYGIYFVVCYNDISEEIINMVSATSLNAITT